MNTSGEKVKTMKTQNTTHTPGPWTFNGDHVVAGTHTVVADPFASDALFGGEGEANANLIAAAPEMLSALEAICDDADEDTDSGAAILATARAAIAKAKGQQ